MKRRTALKNTALMMGGILSASTIVSILDGCVAPASGEVWTPGFLSIEQGEVVTKIADILIPTTDTPGAVDALIPQFIDLVVQKVYSEEEQKMLETGFKDFEAACVKANEKSFSNCSSEEQLAFLQETEKDFIASEESTFFGKMKWLIYKGFFSSEIGATQVLKYDSVPGNYDGCIPFSDVNGTWAT